MRRSFTLGALSSGTIATGALQAPVLRAAVQWVKVAI
jgi:hypothetical protein